MHEAGNVYTLPSQSDILHLSIIIPWQTLKVTCIAKEYVQYLNKAQIKGILNVECESCESSVEYLSEVWGLIKETYMYHMSINYNI